MTDQTSLRPILDHIVILVAYHDLQELPSRLKDSLTIIDGGSHADGRTLNKLVIFPDGTYIELIAFQDGLDPERRKEHRWGSLDEGAIIDWAHTLPHESDFSVIQKRLGETSSGITYRDPVKGGRIRPDGTELKWAVASAQDTSDKPLHPGSAPFWCLDRTPRNLRVPYSKDDQSGAPSYTEHPSGARGVSQVTVSVPEQHLPALSQVYDAIHGPATTPDGENKSWQFLVHSGAKEGKQAISLRGSKAQRPHIDLALLGDERSPRSIEVLPGLTLGFGN